MATYLDMAIKDKKALCDWIERKLGAPLVRVELTQEMLDDAIDEAMELYTKYVTPDRKYHVLNLSKFPASGYTMPGNVASVFALDDDGRPDTEGTLWSANSQLANSIGGGSGFYGGTGWSTSVGQWTTYELALGHGELVKRMSGGGYQFEYNNQSKILDLIPNPGLTYVPPASSESPSGSGDIIEIPSGVCLPPTAAPTQAPIIEPPGYNKHTGYIVLGCNVIRPETQQYGENWVKRYALALSKITLGRVRNKFQGTQLLGGATIDGSDLISEGKEEQDALVEELTISEYRPPMFFIG